VHQDGESRPTAVLTDRAEPTALEYQRGFSVSRRQWRVLGRLLWAPGIVLFLAIGAPCLVSDAIHIAAPIADASAAILAPPTAAGLADGIRRLNAADAADLGRRGRQFVLEAFDWPTVVGAFVDGLERAIGSGRDG